ncbi:MAG: hypothetical protein IVW36_00760 [Dehalococcoidia bacterium]|nr:hypothetical protein [Dehalococcoidia bacterium]
MPSVAETFVSRFHFDWSDLYSDESVRHVTIDKRRDDLSALIDARDAYHDLGFAIFSTLGDDLGTHPTPFLKLEAENDFTASVYVVFGGYYRQGFQLLRTWIELTVAGAYWGGTLYDRPESEYHQWLDGKKNTPKWHAMLNAVLGKDTWRTKGDLAQRLDDLRECLSDYTHLRRLRELDTQVGRDNVPRYLVEVYERWRDAFVEGALLVCELWIRLYPELLRACFKDRRQYRDEAEEALRRLCAPVADAFVEAVG